MMSSSSKSTETKSALADLEPTLEDKFLLVKLSSEIENETDIKELKRKAILLAKLAIMRQTVIKKLTVTSLQFEIAAIHKSYKD